ncbi:hypothetical protein ACLOJK_030699 [Asimina triloba]
MIRRRANNENSRKTRREGRKRRTGRSQIKPERFCAPEIERTENDGLRIKRLPYFGKLSEGQNIISPSALLQILTLFSLIPNPRTFPGLIDADSAVPRAPKISLKMRSFRCSCASSLVPDAELRSKMKRLRELDLRIGFLRFCCEEKIGFHIVESMCVQAVSRTVRKRVDGIGF